MGQTPCRTEKNSGDLYQWVNSHRSQCNDYHYNRCSNAAAVASRPFHSVPASISRSVASARSLCCCHYKASAYISPSVFHLYHFFPLHVLPYQVFDLFPAAACSPLVLIIRPSPNPKPRSWVKRGSALILILHFSLKDRLKRLWRWAPEAVRLQECQEEGAWGEEKTHHFPVPTSHFHCTSHST